MTGYSKSPTVLVAGNTVLDILVKNVADFQSQATDNWSNNVQLLSQPVNAVLGGGGAASAYVLGQLDLTVQLNSNLGTDHWGKILRSWLADANVDIIEPLMPATAVNIILLTTESKRHACYYTGEKVPWRRSLTTQCPEWFLATGYGDVDSEDAADLLHVFRQCRSQGTKVFFDPSPWFDARISTELMLSLWSEVDCLVGTEEELQFWLPELSLAALANRALQCGPSLVVIKRGPEGAFFASKNQSSYVNVSKVANANTVGAGDTFNGRLLFGLCQNETPTEAVAAAAALATKVVQQGRGVLGAF